MADDLKAGDAVQLNGGSPTMTIDFVAPQIEGDTTQGAMCSWFDQKGNPQQRWYPLTSLKKYEAQLGTLRTVRG